jgi:RHS repeat-associated protein
VTRNDYDPYGRMSRVGGTEDSRFGYTGHFSHYETGLTLAMYRVYDASLARWLSKDPLAEIDGPNLYSYVSGNPVHRTDLLGLQSWPTPHPGVVTGPYGEVRAGGVHTGADLRARSGETISSTDNGIVTSTTPSSSGGNQIIVHNADGSVSGYAHTLPVVRVGDSVAEGQQIGRSDGSGTGAPHLHLTYRPKPGAAKEDPIPRLILSRWRKLLAPGRGCKELQPGNRSRRP